MTTKVPNSVRSVLTFDGVKDRIELTQSLTEIKDAVSIEFWINGGSNLNANTSIIGAYGADKTKRILNIHLPWVKNIYWDAGNTSGYDRINKGLKSAEYKNSWNHWVFTKNANTGIMSIFLNGEVWHTAQGKNISLAAIQTFIIGSYNSKQYHWAGSLAEFRIWNIALEQNQIQTNMHRPLTGSENGLLVYLPLNERQGSLAQDQSKTGKKNNGNIIGGTWKEMAIPVEPEATDKETKPKSARDKPNYIPTTGLEDYGRWKSMFKDHKKDKNEKPFRRGRIWS